MELIQSSRLESFNQPSIMKTKGVVKSFCIAEDFLLIGNDCAQIEVLNWVDQKCIQVYNLLDGECKSGTDYGLQVLNVRKVFNVKNLTMAQLRNGDIFLFNFSSKAIEIKIKISTGIETFTKFSIVNTTNELSIVASSMKEDELIVFYISENEENKLTVSSNCRLINLNEKEDQTEVENDEEGEINKSHGLVCAIFSDEAIPFIVVVQEGSRITLIDKTFKILTNTKSEDKNIDPKPIISSNVIQGKKKNEFFILCGLHHTEIEIFLYDSNSISLSHHSKIEKVCSELKPGISSLDFIRFKKLDDREYYILATGAYDYKLRLYSVNFSSKLDIDYLGMYSQLTSSIIHQVQFFEDSESNNLYLFLAGDSKLIYIFSIL